MSANEAPKASGSATDSSIGVAKVDPAPSPSSQNNKQFMEQRLKKEARESNPHATSIGYAIAFVTLGAAFGNMFLAGKIKRVMNVKIPNFDADATYSKFQQQAAKEQARRAQQQASQSSRQRFQEEYAKYKEYAGKTGAVPSWSSQDRNLHALGLKRHQCNEPDIKKAFFALAKVHHPDTLPHDISPQEKELRVKKFQEINEAYQALLQHVKAMESIAHHP